MVSKNVIDLRNKKPERPQQPALFSPTPERPGKRASPVRTRRRRVRLAIAFAIIIFIGAVTYGISWASYLPQYSVQSVSIVGAQQVSSDLIHTYVETLLYNGGHPFLSKNNIFLYNPDAIAREIVGYFPRIASATVSRQSLLATAVTVSIVERQSYAIWCQSDQTTVLAGTDDTHSDLSAQAGCYEMDQTGYIFAQAPVPGYLNVVSSTDSTSSPQTESGTSTPTQTPQSSSKYIFEGGIATSTNPIGQTFASTHTPGIVALLQLLGQAGFTPTGAIVQNDQDFWVPLSQGFYIKASFGEDPQDLVSNLQLVLSSSDLQGKQNQLEYVDLRFGNRVYYKLQGSVETQTQS